MGRGCEGVTWVRARGVAWRLQALSNEILPSIDGNLNGENDDQPSNVCGMPCFRTKLWVKECNPKNGCLL